MCVHPYISGLTGRERQREMIAQADRRRRARQLSELARASRRAEGAGRHQRRTAAALTRLLPRYRAVR